MSAVMNKCGSRTLIATVVATVVAGVLAPVGAGGQALAAPGRALTASAATGSAKTALTEQAAEAKAADTGADVEITSLRSESSEVYATADGQLEAVQHVRPVRARVRGAWKPVDNTLAKTGDGTVAPAAPAVDMAFSGGGDTPLVSLERAGKKLAYSWPTSLPAPALEGDTATYKNVLPDVDLQLRADVDGFHQLLVVRTAEAAKNPALAELKLGVDAPGLTLKESAQGGLEAHDNGGGGLAFEAPTPLMWDSAGPAATRSAKALTAEPRAGAAEAEGPGDASNVAPIGVEVAADGSELRLTPDQDMLGSAATHFPVFIDPQTYTPKAGAWTMVSRYWADSPQWRFNGDSDAGVGDCEWSYCAPYDVKRVFFQMPTSAFAGKSILSATFVAHETHSASCDGRGVELWRTKGIGKATTWNNSQDDWLDRLETRDVAYGGGTTCPGGDVEFNAIDGVKYAASHNDSSTSFGLRASSETDKFGWKRFSDDAYLRVKYNNPPKQIAMSHLSMNPGGMCKKPENKVSVHTRPMIQATDVTDPDHDQVSVQFQAYWDTGDGKGTVARWTSAKTTPKKSGSNFSTALPSSIPKNKTVDWAARAIDYDAGKYYSYSPWSQTGSATACYFIYDPDAPPGPKISSGDYPAINDEDPADPSYDGVGRYGNFTMSSTDTSVTRYWFGVNEEPSEDNEVLTTAGAAKTVSFRPTKSGTNFLYAATLDAAGNKSAPIPYEFKVKAGQPARAQWKLDDAAGSSQAEGSAGDRTLAVNGAPTLGVEGAVGDAVSFDGAHDYLQSDIPTVVTSAGFSVSAWVKLSKMPDGAAVIATQPGNNSPGFELYYSKTSDRWAFDQYTADTASATPVRAMQASGGGVKPDEWVHLAGTYSTATDLLSLYVNGSLAGTAAYATPWDAHRGLQIGAGSYDGKPASYFPGAIDDIRIYDKPLAPADVTQLASKKSLNAGRPARAVFPLDDSAVGGDGKPTMELHGQADVEAAVLKNGAEPGEAGAYGKALSLDGVDDYATTVSPHVNNQASFSVVAWARLSTKPTHAGIVATQTGKVKPGFELYYSPTYGWSFNQYTADSTAGTPVRASQGGTTKSPAGEWTQLLGSYDAVTNDLRLYVNGVWVSTAKFTAPFYGGGPVQIGAGSYSGKPDSFFPGQVDDVQVYDRALSAPEASDLYRARPIVEGRWRLDGAAGSPAVSPDDLPTSTARHPLTLGSGASIDTSGSNNYVGIGGLLLDGTTSSYAATAASPLHTNASFTASTWVTTPGRPDHPVTVMSQAGAKNSAFTVRYMPDKKDPVNAGAWQLDMADTDGTTTTHTVAEHTNFQDNTWTNITVVYDAFTTEMRLYVNGEVRQTSCLDDDDDGVPNDPACTEKASWNSDVHPFDASQGLQLGRTRTGGSFGEYWSGGIDDVWMLQGVATDEQIAELAGGVDLATNPGP
ncbi:LamG-like jellyroll fold domain-containing protein [Streptomyces sp. NPDC006649]|uniref:LamG-like jellyroll fold domain-containing protein n=1 Tax=Streptomyces sp. NPDC006649 TaxID=3156896 RepID=UPI0033A4182C